MAERKPNSQTDWLQIVRQAFDSNEFAESFRSASDEQRASFIVFLDRVLPRFRAEHKMLSGFGPMNERIRFLFRPHKYLQLPSPEGLAQMPFSKQALNFIDQYRANVGEFGDDALAHLCLEKRYFEVLTIDGICLINPSLRPRPPISDVFTVKTIAQLRELRNRLLTSGAGDTVTHRWGYAVSLWGAFHELEKWDAIPEPAKA